MSDGKSSGKAAGTPGPNKYILNLETKTIERSTLEKGSELFSFIHDPDLPADTKSTGTISFKVSITYHDEVVVVEVEDLSNVPENQQ